MDLNDIDVNDNCRCISKLLKKKSSQYITALVNLFLFLFYVCCSPYSVLLNYHAQIQKVLSEGVQL